MGSVLPILEMLLSALIILLRLIVGILLPVILHLSLILAQGTYHLLGNLLGSLYFNGLNLIGDLFFDRDGFSLEVFRNTYNNAVDFIIHHFLGTLSLLRNTLVHLCSNVANLLGRLLLDTIHLFQHVIVNLFADGVYRISYLIRSIPGVILDIVVGIALETLAGIVYLAYRMVEILLSKLFHYPKPLLRGQ
jgi:hypothetical protein